MDKTQEYMELLHCSMEEAQSVIEYDKTVDKMTTVKQYESDLSPEQKKNAKKYRQGERKPTTYNFSKRQTVKKNEVRQNLVALLAEALQAQDFCNDITITNAERQIDFLCGDKKMRIVLSAPTGSRKG